MNIEFIVFGTHEYQWALKPFAALFAKYWGGQTVTYVGDHLNGPLPDNIEFMQVPAYKEGIWPWKHWFGNGVKSALSAFNENLVVVLLPDHWFRRQVNHEAVNAMAEYMLEAGNVIRGNLPDDTNLENYGKVIAVRDGIEIIVCGDIHHCGKEAGTALSPAIWNRHLFLELLEPHWGLWATEKLGTEKMMREHPDWISIGTRPAALGRMNPIRDGKKRQMRGMMPREIWLEGMPEEDRQIVRPMIPRRYDVVE